MVTIKDLLEKTMPTDSFVGHIGGDDFVAIIQSHDIDPICETLIECFDQGILEYYSLKGKENGFIVTKNRKGEEEQLPIMSVSVAGVSNKSHTFTTVNELAEYAGELKRQCKLIWTSCHMVG